MQGHYFACRINPPGPDIWTRLEIDAPLANATGGEGGIFNVKGSAVITRVAKIYNDDAKATLDPNAFAALAYLTSKYQSFSAEMPFVAWPMEVLFSEEKPLSHRHLQTLSGITMRRIDGHTTLEKLTTNGTGRVGLGNEAAVRIAATIAGQLKKLHRHGIVFCDFNPRNVLVSHKKDSVMFVDADAFQHGFAHQVFTKPHFTPGYASIDHLTNAPGPRGPRDDNFVLAIHIFQLLTDGGHPFKSGCRYDPPEGTPLFGELSPDDNILARRWPYSDVPLFQPPGQTPQHYARFHPDLKAMFERAFQRFDPPTAEEWENLLPRFRSSTDDPGTRLNPPNVNAISRPPVRSVPPRAAPQPSVSAPRQPQNTQTRVVPPFTPPKPPSPLRRTVRAATSVLQFIFLLIFTLFRGGPIAVMRLIGTMLATAAYNLGRAYPRATLGTIFGTVAFLFLYAYATDHQRNSPAPHAAIITAPVLPKVAANPPVTKPAVTAPPAAKRPVEKREAAIEPEVLPWKAVPTQATGSVDQIKKPKPSATDANTARMRAKEEAARQKLADEEIRRRAAQADAQRRANANGAGWSWNGESYSYRPRGDDQPVFRITPTH